MDATSLRFGTIKKGIIELLNDRLRAFCADIDVDRIREQSLFIQDYVNLPSFKTLENRIARSQEQEIEIELRSK